MRLYRGLRSSGLALACLAAWNCGSSGDGPIQPPPALVPTTIATSGSGQTGTVGAALESPIGITVTDQNGDPLSGIVVSFAVTAGGGSLGATSVTTGAGGGASTIWNLGTVAGASNNGVSVTMPGYAGAPVSFVASALAGPAATLAVASGDRQTGMVGAELPAKLQVIVRDSYGNGVAGATVTWTVGGGGWVSSATVATSMTGTSAVTRTLGSTIGGQSTTASAAGVTPASAVFTATATAVASQYGIELRSLTWSSPPTVFVSAAARWSNIIIGDLPPTQVVAAPGDCFYNSPAMNEVIDDVLILISADSIDGPLGILAGASPCWIRSTGGLTIVGGIVLDSADIAFMYAQGIYDAVVLHEMGHVIGVGSLWPYVSPPLLAGAGGPDPYFNGADGVFQFGRDGGAVYAGVPVPVENLGGPGTQDSHWRESVMGKELMTGYVSLISNPLSTITIASLADMGYTVSYATADPYTVSSVNLRAGGGGNALHLLEMRSEVKIKSVDAFGRITRVR